MCPLMPIMQDVCILRASTSSKMGNNFVCILVCQLLDPVTVGPEHDLTIDCFDIITTTLVNVAIITQTTSPSKLPPRAVRVTGTALVLHRTNHR